MDKLRVVSTESWKMLRQEWRRRVSDLLLQGGHGERLDDSPRGPRLHHVHLAEDLSLARFSRGLDAGLEPAQPRKRELADARHLRRGDCRKLVDDLLAGRPFQITPSCQCLREATLGHGLAGSLHRRCRLQRLRQHLAEPTWEWGCGSERVHARLARNVLSLEPKTA